MEWINTAISRQRIWTLPLVAFCLILPSICVAQGQDTEELQKLANGNFLSLSAYLPHKKFVGGGSFVYEYVLTPPTLARGRYQDWLLQANLEYGTLGATQVTPSGTKVNQEDDLSPNTGTIKTAYRLAVGGLSSVQVDAGLEHRRTSKEDVVNGVTVFHGEKNDVYPTARLSAAYLLAPGFGKQNPGTETVYGLYAALQTANALYPNNKSRRDIFAEPAAKIIAQFAPKLVAQNNELPRVDYYSVELRADAALAYALNGQKIGKGNYDVRLTYFLSSTAGLQLRYFDGYFGHNFRDRKRLPTLNFVLELP